MSSEFERQGKVCQVFYHTRTNLSLHGSYDVKIAITSAWSHS